MSRFDNTSPVHKTADTKYSRPIDYKPRLWRLWLSNCKSEQGFVVSEKLRKFFSVIKLLLWAFEQVFIYLSEVTLMHLNLAFAMLVLTIMNNSC